ncbi:hypothetical protein BT96DRAFT_978801 [Gymnopus androsaceus JB14]|uniref:Teneurin-like YD-shell domain-containing protein n=1 Tax=Gymnopus androsaceus JB14 TaxID=1447944 RepID=A0A6A4H7G0_9AGAR|nr:hypothetical protein BT96DRAFT_978801 [Gymnopus androsaceus JB14]
MASKIVGTLPIIHSIDANGSLSLDINVQVPPAKMAPHLSLAYSSASTAASTVGMGWALKGISVIERVAATKAQDGFRGVVNYNEQDRFALDGRRLMHISGAEYRYEMEQWSKIVAEGDSKNPTSWKEYLPDGSIRVFGTTDDSNIKAVGQPATRVWAVSQYSDAFSNYVSYKYANDTTNGSFYPSEIMYGGNQKVNMTHQRQLTFEYEQRPDISTKYIGGSQVQIDKRLKSISSLIHDTLVHKHTIEYDTAPLTGITRAKYLTLADASGATVSPLQFDWVDGSSKVFEEPGFREHCRSDVVVASKVTVSGSVHSRIATHIASEDGTIASAPSAIHTGGKVYKITVLISTPKGFEAQPPLEFKQPSTAGFFRCGDFEGNGRVGLIYIFKSNNTNVKFVQFISDGKGFTRKSTTDSDGPTGIVFDDMKVVVGDLDGNGEEDVFLLSPKTKDGRKCCHISFLQSQNGTLKFTPHDGLVKAGESISWSDVSPPTFFPYAVDEDGKTSILVASKRTSNSRLLIQVLRSTGRTLLPAPPPLETAVPYDGSLTVTRTSSTSSLDIVNTFHSNSGTAPTENLHVEISEWFLPYGRRSSARYRQRIFKICPMRCASSQPVDYLTGYVNGMGARISITYAPLSDNSIYEADARGSSALLAASNAMAFNISSMANLSASKSASSVSEMSHGRSDIIYFPAWVAKQVISSPYAAKTSAKEQTDYTYKNARIDFDGRGWLGFERITKSSSVLGTSESTWYLQHFPFLGQVAKTETKSKDDQMLQTRVYGWDDVLATGDITHSIRMSSLSEVYYEGGIHAYTANATYEYDSFGNITKLSIVSPETSTPAITISSTFENSTESEWVIGSRTRELVQNGAVLKESLFSYVPGTQSPKETKTWVEGNKWSIQTTEFDETGNELVLHGPGPARREFQYDETYSNIISSKSLVSSEGESLTETMTFSLENGKPLSFTDANGNTTSFTYDVLGRIRETFQESPSKKVVKREAYLMDGSDFKHVVESRTAWDKEEWFHITEYLDGMNRARRTERPRPDNSNILVYTETEYDGAGRITATSRDYLYGATPEFTRYIYDAHSRVIEEIIPPPSSRLPSVTITSQFKFASGLSECIQTSTAGTGSKTTTSKILYLPAADKPSVDNLLTPCAVVSCDELGYQINTTFDGLARPIAIKDSGEVQLALSWDGLDRLISRRVSQNEDGNPKDINHSSLTYDDDKSTTTIQNVLTGVTKIATYDFTKRPISVVSPDEKLVYTYDTGGTYAKGRLMSATSELSGVAHRYDYDIQGQLTVDELRIDEQSYTTSYKWSPLRQLVGIVNPDGSSINRSLCPDGESISRVELADANSQSIRGSVRPTSSLRVWEWISSLSSMHLNGALASIALSKEEQSLHRQDWEIDAFQQIKSYNREHLGDKSGSVEFQYDISGQLSHSTKKDPKNAAVEEYSMENPLSIEDGRLSSIDDHQGNTECSFTYSKDGHILEKKDSSGAVTRTTKYDSGGRLIQVDDTHMVYDVGGRLLKCTRGSGDITIYPSQTYEVDIPSSGKKKHTSYLVHGYRRASLTNEDGDAVVHYFHNDQLGSTVAVSDSEGIIITQYKYDAFGKVSVEGKDVARYKFSGKELIEDLYYFGARFYDCSIGRFLTLDNYPVDLDDIRPCTFNMYTFSKNDPVNFVDWNGNAPFWQWFLDAALIAVGVALMFVPVVGPLATIAMGALAGGLTGAGIAGLNASIAGADAKEWGIQVGIGGLFGAIGGGLSAGIDVGIDAALPSITMTTKAGVTGIAKFAGKFLANQAAKFVAGKGVETLGQLVNNAAHGRPAQEGLLDIIPGAGSGGTDWVGLGEQGALGVLGFASGKYKASKISGKYTVSGQSSRFSAKSTGIKAKITRPITAIKSKITGNHADGSPINKSPNVELTGFHSSGSRYTNVAEITRL